MAPALACGIADGGPERFGTDRLGHGAGVAKPGQTMACRAGKMEGGGGQGPTPPRAPRTYQPTGAQCNNRGVNAASAMALLVHLATLS